MEEEKDKESAQVLSEEQVELPPVTFENFILNLYNVALINLGVRDPDTGKIIRNLPMAKHTIDTLEMIEEKTKGNLTAPEGNLLENLLYELRMGYLRAIKQAESEQQKEAKKEE